MNENKRGLVENELEKVAGGRLRHRSPEKDLSDEDRQKLKEFINDRSGYVFRGRTVPNRDKK
jgi:hypothetical protein